MTKCLLFYGFLASGILINHRMKHDHDGSDREAAKEFMRPDLDLRTNDWGLAVAIASGTCKQH